MQGLPEIGDVLDDTYEITQQLGQGGFGAVYLARQMSMDREVALKVLVAHAMKVDEMIQRFRREVMAVRNLSHPNTIRIYDFHDGADGVLYYSMEYVKGPTLKEIIKQGPIAPARTRHILRQILKSLSEAHSYGIVHRDLKPANIMLAEMHGEEDFVKVLDFGIAKIMDQNDGTEEAEALTSAGVLVGTLRYMAPEQIAGGEIGPQSDLYALGLIGIEMLTGQSVFAGTGRWEVLHKQISDEPVDIPESVQTSGMYEFFRRTLAKDTKQRFISADEMLKAIDTLAVLSDSPIVDADGATVSPVARQQNTPISQSGPNSGVGRPGTDPNRQVFESGQQVPVQVGATDAADEATQFHPLPSDASGQASQSGQMATPSGQIASESGQMAAQPGQVAVQPTQRQPMMTPMPRQGAAFQTSPPPGLGGHAQASFDNTGSFDNPSKSGNGKLIAIIVVLLLLIAGAVGILFGTGMIGGDSADAVAAVDVDAGTQVDDEIAAVETDSEDVETTPTIDEETVEPRWVRLETAGVEASVFDGDELVGTTPVRLSVKDSQILMVKAQGYEDREVAVGPDSDDVVAVELTSIEVEEPVEDAKPEPTQAKTSSSSSSKPKATTKPEEKPADDGWIDVPTKTKPAEKSKDTDVPIF